MKKLPFDGIALSALLSTLVSYSGSILPTAMERRTEAPATHSAEPRDEYRKVEWIPPLDSGYLVVGSDGGSLEGSWGNDSSGKPLGLGRASGVCGTVRIDGGVCN